VTRPRIGRLRNHGSTAGEGGGFPFIFSRTLAVTKQTPNQRVLELLPQGWRAHCLHLHTRLNLILKLKVLGSVP